MWKQKPVSADRSVPIPISEPTRPAAGSLGGDGSARPRAAVVNPDQAVIGKGIVVKGEISGVDSLFIDGRVEGAIHIPGERVTVAKNGQVIGSSGAPCISAREIVIMGHVKGNISAGERVDIRADGALTGDVSTARVSIEDGAFFRGGIDIRRDEPKPAVQAPQPLERVPAI